MTTDTELTPLTAEQASEAARILADYAAEHGDEQAMSIADALLALRDRRHVVIETAELERLRADTRRLDWLADPGQFVGNVQLPTRCVEAHPESLRAAIDAAQREEDE